MLQTSATDLSGLDWPSEQSRAQQLWSRRESAGTKWRTSPGQEGRWGWLGPCSQARVAASLEWEWGAGWTGGQGASWHSPPASAQKYRWSQCGGSRPLRAERAVPPSHPHPPPSEQWALLLPRNEEEEAGPGLGRIWDSEWVRRGASGRDPSGVAGQPPRAPWAAGLSSPRLRIRFFLSKRVEVTVFLSPLMNRFWVARVTIETGAILSK